jgi:hypothetical protein
MTKILEETARDKGSSTQSTLVRYPCGVLLSEGCERLYKIVFLLLVLDCQKNGLKFHGSSDFLRTSRR